MQNSVAKFIIKFVTISFAFLFVLYLSVLLLFPRNFNINKYKSEIENEIKNQTGIETAIENISVRTNISPHLYIDVHHLMFLYPDNKELLKIKDLNIKVQVLPIIFRKIKVDKIIVNRPILSLSIDEDGLTSLDKYLSKKYIPSGNFSGFKFDSKIPNIELNRYKIKVYDKMYAYPFAIEGEKFFIEQSKIHKGGIKTITSGVLQYNKTPYINYSTEIETTFPKIKDRMFNTNPFRYIKQYSVKANISSKIVLKKENDKIKIIGNSEINKLSFILNGVKLDNNYIFLNFKDDKININANLKTDEKDNIKVIGTSTIAKKSFIDLKCSSKNAELQKIQQTAITILNALGIKNSLSEYNFSGKTSFDFKIKSNFKTIQSEGFAEIYNAEISGKTIPYNVKKINSKINFNNNKITINDSSLLLNDTPLSINGVVDEKTNLNINIKSADLVAEKISKLFLPKEITNQNEFKGVVNFVLNLQGTIKKPSAICDISLKDFSVFNKQLQVISFSEGKINITGFPTNPIGTIKLYNSNILPKDFSKALAANELFVEIFPKEILIKNNKLLLDNEPVILNAIIKNYQDKNPDYDLTLNGKLKSSYIYSVLKKEKELKNIEAATKGVINFNAKIIGKGTNGQINSEFFADKDNYISAIVIKELLNNPSKTVFAAEYENEKLFIKELSLNNQTEPVISINGTISNLKNIELDNLKILIPNSMTFSASKLKNSEITVKSDLNIDGKLENPNIQGNLEIKNIIIPEYSLKSEVNNILFDKNNIKLTIPKMEIGDSSLNIQANINSDFTKGITLKDIEIKSDFLDMDKINEAFDNQIANSAYPGVEIPLTIPTGKAMIKIFRTGGLQAEDIICDISLKNNILKMQNIEGKAYKGTISGQSEYNFLHTSTISDLIGKNAQIYPIMKDLTGKNDEITGTVDYKVKMSTIGTKKLQQQRTARGYVEYSAKNGVLGPLGQFEHFLYAQNLISQSIMKTTVLGVTKALKPQNTGLYTVSNGKIEIIGGNAYLKPITVEGPNMSLYVTGKINILNEISDVKIYGRISQDVEKVLGDLSNPMPKTIMSESSETSIGNLFYDEYNTTISKSILEAIPQLNPSGLSSRPFEVKIQGYADNIKAVKSFKWITSTTTAPKIIKEINNTIDNDMIEENTNSVIEKEEKTQLPSFLDSLPDDIN